MIIIEMMTTHGPQDVKPSTCRIKMDMIYPYIYIHIIIYPLCKRDLISKTLDRLGCPWSHEIRPCFIFFLLDPRCLGYILHYFNIIFYNVFSVYIILLKVVSIVLHLQLSGSSSSPGSFRSFQRAALQAGHLWGSHKGAGNRPKKCGFTARFLEKRWNMINPRPGMKLFSI